MNKPAIWFPTVKTNTGTDIFTERLVEGLCNRGINAAITWLPLRAEYAPFTVSRPSPPEWANIIHTNSWLYSGFLPSKIPTVVTVHHTIHQPEFRKKKGGLRALYHRYWIAPNERRMLQRAECVTAVSQFVADATRMDILDRPIEVIHNGIDIKRFYPHEKGQGKPFRLLYVGSWTSRKGVDLLKPIMEKLGPGFELFYTGPAKGNVKGNTYDIGVLDGERQVANAMQNADALLFPSRSEGFGLVVVEAMACGLPVVTSRISPITEIIEDGVNGLLCPVNNTSAFVRSLRALRDNPQLHKRISHAGIERVISNFSIDAMIDKYLAIYENVSSGCPNERGTK